MSYLKSLEFFGVGETQEKNEGVRSLSSRQAKSFTVWERKLTGKFQRVDRI